ncbi:transglutaminaseTgpA domain-containing protein [Streptomyces sp. BI20]|uniref:transglutaminase family protein n=1 Tax=Streptomyces sp. BI20 TaxID=3403460 RepID=UPI003C74B799
MSGQVRLTVGAALATLLTALSLTSLVDSSGGWLAQATVLLALQGAVGAAVRRAPVPRALVVGAQVLVSWLALGLLFAGLGPVPNAGGGGWFLLDPVPLVLRGTQDVAEFAIPAPVTDGIRLLLLVGVLLVGLLVDLLAVTLRAAAAAGLPLLALYSVAGGLAGSLGHGWLWFLTSGLGFLLLLSAEGRDRLAGWGRVFGGAPNAAGGGGMAPGRTPAPVRTGRVVGAVALASAVLLPALLPALGPGLLSPSDREAAAGGGGTISAVNPLVALQSNLNARDNREVLRYRTDDPQVAEQYLRIVSLDAFDGVTWESSARSLTEVPTELPAPPGPSGELLRGADTVRSSFSASLDYGQRYLPMPYPATRVDVPGRWRFEPVGRTLVGDRLDGDAVQTVRGVRYSVESLRLKPTARLLANAPEPPAALLGEYTKLPDNVPAVVARTARQVTAGASDGYTKAVRLQDWFAREGGFVYDTTTGSGTGADAVARFLAEKRGFCVHFSFSMATMARSLGIPARVAVGFTPGSPQSDGSMSVTMRDAHAWPELYFEGVGWTRFEPTPRAGISLPAYTVPDAPDARPSASAAVPSASASAAAPAPSRSTDCPPELRRLGECGVPAAAAGASGAAGGAVPWPVLGWTAAGLLVAGLLAVPGLWRARVRRGRLDSGDPLALWREVEDTVWDLGAPPDGSLSPRAAARRVVAFGSLDTPTTEAAHRLATAVERTLYAPPGAAGSSGAGSGAGARDVRVVLAGLRADASWWSRRRAAVLPRSAARPLRAAADRAARARAAWSARLATLRSRLPNRLGGGA